MAAPAGKYNEWAVLPLVTLTSIATVIGSGILALPVTLASTPVPLFLLLFTAALAAQILVVLAVTELLQRARAAQLARGYDSIPSSSVVEDVSLYNLARLFLPSLGLRAVYYVSTFLGFVAIIVSYGLAGPQAVWQLMSAATSSAPPIPVFVFYWAVGTIAVTLFVEQLLPVFGSFTVLKGVLFVAVIFIVAMLPAGARVTSVGGLMADMHGWQNSASPFLMSCVALGGLANTTPVTFNLLPPHPTASQVRRFRGAVILAIFLCYALNVGWVFAVLQVVPRTAPDGKVSLTQAYDEGQISTIPLVAVLHSGDAVGGSVLKSIELIVEMFIVVSTAVSYFVMSTGMKSFLDGIARNPPRQVARIPVFYTQWFLYALSFGSILGLVVGNPKGFISVLTRFSSLTLNLQAGLLLFVMLYYSRTRLVGDTLDDTELKDAVSAAAAADDYIPPERVHVVYPVDEVAPAEEDVFTESALSVNDDVASAAQQIPLPLSSTAAVTAIIFGSVFFALACFLAAFGPLLGIKLGGHE